MKKVLIFYFFVCLGCTTTFLVLLFVGLFALGGTNIVGTTFIRIGASLSSFTCLINIGIITMLCFPYLRKKQKMEHVTKLETEEFQQHHKDDEIQPNIEEINEVPVQY